MTRDVLFLIAAVVLISSAALLVWYYVTVPDLRDLVHNFVPHVSPTLLILGAIMFSMVNALLEEVAYRGVLLHAVDPARGVGAVSLFMQAIPFGLLHFSGGFPRSWIGVGLAVIYGVIQGVIRRRAQGCSRRISRMG